MSSCMDKGCDGRTLAKGYCQRHYDQARRLLNPNSSEYESWQAMKRRCSLKNKAMRRYYYDRGIDVCNRWSHSFEQFLEDMGKKPTLKHTLDRIDNDKGYSPHNCKWATREEQALNRRVHNLNSTGIVGVHKLDHNRWGARIKINGKSMWLGTYNSLDEALTVRKLAEQTRGCHG